MYSIQNSKEFEKNTFINFLVFESLLVFQQSVFVVFSFAMASDDDETLSVVEIEYPDFKNTEEDMDKIMKKYILSKNQKAAKKGHKD